MENILINTVTLYTSVSRSSLWYQKYFKIIDNYQWKLILKCKITLQSTESNDELNFSIIWLILSMSSSISNSILPENLWSPFMVQLSICGFEFDNIEITEQLLSISELFSIDKYSSVCNNFRCPFEGPFMCSLYYYSGIKTICNGHFIVERFSKGITPTIDKYLHTYIDIHIYVYTENINLV